MLTPDDSWTSEETLHNEAMSDAQENPLAHQLNSVQIQPFDHYPSHDTHIDPDNILPSEFNNDEPELQTQNPTTKRNINHMVMHTHHH